MEAFNLWYAVGSLIAAAVVGLLIISYLPVYDLIKRNRFKKLFGFPPPKGKRGPGSRSISWERREKIISYLAIAAYWMDNYRKGKRFCLKWALRSLAGIVALEGEEYEEYKARMVKEIRYLFFRFLSDHRGYLRERRKFRRSCRLAKQFGFGVTEDYRFYAQRELERRIGSKANR